MSVVYREDPDAPNAHCRTRSSTCSITRRLPAHCGASSKRTPGEPSDSLGWTMITLHGSHLRSSRLAPCLSSGRLPSPADASELRDVKFNRSRSIRHDARRRATAEENASGIGQDTVGREVVRSGRRTVTEHHSRVAEGAGLPACARVNRPRSRLINTAAG